MLRETHHILAIGDTFENIVGYPVIIRGLVSQAFCSVSVVLPVIVSSRLDILSCSRGVQQLVLVFLGVLKSLDFCPKKRRLYCVLLSIVRPAVQKRIPESHLSCGLL